MIGDSIGRYTVERELGSGPVATVWLCEDGNDRVAIKQLHPHLADDEIIYERFVREFRLASELSHPNIVKIYDLIDADKSPGIIMEYVNGGNLARQPQFDLQRFVILAVALAGAVAYAHDRGVVHRNLGPENILVNAAGEIKLTDFGSAHIGDLMGLTTSTMFSRSPAYVAPEVMSGQTTDPRSDLYSIGVILYEQLTGTLPEIRTYQNSASPEDAKFEKIPKTAPPWLVEIIRALLVPAEKRIQTAGGLLALIKSRRRPTEKRNRYCVHCKKETPFSLPVCVHCGEYRISVPRWERADAESLVLKSIKENDEVFADFVFILRCISGNQSVSPNILTGDIRLYSKEEKRRGIRLPVRIIDNIGPETSDRLIRLFERNGSTKIHIHRRLTTKLTSREKRGPLIATNNVPLYPPEEIINLKGHLQNAAVAGGNFYTDILATTFRIRLALPEDKFLDRQKLLIETMLDQIKNLGVECKRASEFLKNISLGQLYGSIVALNRRIEKSIKHIEIETLIREKTRLKEMFERFRQRERALSGKIALLCSVRSALESAAESEMKGKDFDRILLDLSKKLSAELLR